MPRYAVFALALVLTTPAAAGVLFDTNFAGPYQPVPSDPHLSGALPAGWYDNSTWAPVSIGYSKQAEAGRSFLRIDIREGFAQLSHSFPDVTSTAYFRLTLSVRGPDLLPVRIGIRQNGPPYDYFWSLTQTYPNAWRELTYWFQLEPLRDAGLYLNVTGAGVFDMAAFRIEQFSYAEAVSIFQQGGTGGPDRKSVV